MKSRARINWKTCAKALAATIPRERLHPDVVAWANRPASANEEWGIALSGGADSVAVLLLVWAHWPEQRHRLRALHFDHRLRGTESTRDAAFCRKMCRSLGVPITVGRWTRPRRATARTQLPSEGEARQARQEFLHAHARLIWTGHHQDDVAETMLMRLARGSGTGGLAAPRAVHHHSLKVVHVRPLLTLRKTDIINALSSAGGVWREDSTNGTTDYFRNRIRNQVLPAWVAASQRDAVAGAAAARELLEEDDVALGQWLTKIRPFAKNGDLLLRRLQGKPRAIWRRALHRWVLNAGNIDISRQAFNALLTLIERGKPTRQSLGRGIFGECGGGRLRLVFGNANGKFQRSVN